MTKKRIKPHKESPVNLNVQVLMMLLLAYVEALSKGVLTAILPLGVDVGGIDLKKRGAMVLLSVADDQGGKWDGADPLRLEIFVLWRGDTKAPTAGEIQASILSGMTAIPIFRREGYDIIAKHLMNKHVSFTPSAVKGAPGVDLHSSTFEIMMQKTEPENVESEEAKEV